MDAQNQGFTLIELITTLALAAVVIGLAVPSVSHMVRVNAIVSISSNLIADILFARSEAIKRGVPVTVCASTNGTACAGATNNWDKGWLVFVESKKVNGAVEKGESVVRLSTVVTSDTMTIRTAKSTGMNIVGHVGYQGNGLPHIPTAKKLPIGEIRICDSNDVNYSRRIKLNQSGRVQSVGRSNQCP